MLWVYQSNYYARESGSYISKFLNTKFEINLTSHFLSLSLSLSLNSRLALWKCTKTKIFNISIST